MKRSATHIILLVLFHAIIVQRSFAQVTAINYQVILETRSEYMAIDNASKVNAGNWMGLKEFSSSSQLYPILGFKSTGDRLNVKLQTESTIKNYNLNTDSTYFSFHELYAQFELMGKHFIVVGKKRLDWGTGMIWNPTNFFIQKDPVRTQNRLEGIYMLNYSCLFGTNTYSLYLFPDQQGKDFKAAIKYDYSIGRIDGSLSVVEYGKYQQVGYDISYGGDRFIAYAEGVLKNYTKSVKLNDDGTVVAPHDRRKKFRSEVVFGANVIIDSSVSISGEYRFREAYSGKREIELYKQFLPANSGLYDPLSMGKHSLFANIEYKEAFSRWAVNLRSFYDLSSNQFAISPMGSLSLANFQLELTMLFYANSLAIHNSQTSLLLSCFF